MFSARNTLTTLFAFILMLVIHVIVKSDENTIVGDSKTKHKLPILPAGPLGESIKLGEELVAKTSSHPLSKNFVGNKLNCTSCHLKNGTDLDAATFIGIATAYPAWSPREERVITLEDRILNCLMRSCNGIRPPLGSKVSVSIAAYITWLSSNQPIKQNSHSPHGPHAVPKLKLTDIKPNRELGAKLYKSKCADCHNENGQGDKENPPVWGQNSYNKGAGLAENSQLASWLKVAMPLDDARLTTEEAFHLAEFINSHPRPEFILADHLPPPQKLGEYNSK